MNKCDMLRLKNIIYKEREYALKVLLDTIVKSGECSENDVIEMFLKINLDDGTISDDLLYKCLYTFDEYRKKVGEICDCPIKPDPRYNAEKSKDNGKNAAVAACAKHEAVFGHLIEEFTEQELKYFYSNENLMKVTSDKYYFSYINKRQIASGISKTDFRENKDFSDIGTPYVLYCNYFKDPIELKNVLYEAKEKVSDINSFSIVAAALSLLYSGVTLSELCNVRGVDIDCEKHELTTLSGRCIKVYDELWDNVNGILAEKILLFKSGIFDKRMFAVRNEIASKIADKKITDSDMIYSKYFDKRSVFMSGIFYKAFINSIKSRDDFLFFFIDNIRNPKDMPQNIGIVFKIYLQWREMYHCQR